MSSNKNVPILDNDQIEEMSIPKLEEYMDSLVTLESAKRDAKKALSEKRKSHKTSETMRRTEGNLCFEIIEGVFGLRVSYVRYLGLQDGKPMVAEISKTRIRHVMTESELPRKDVTWKEISFEEFQKVYKEASANQARLILG